MTVSVSASHRTDTFFGTYKKIHNYQNSGSNLSDHCCPCSTFNPPSKSKNKQRIQNSINNRTYHNADHRISRTSVCSDHMIPADRQNIKWKSKCSNTCIINSIRHNICSCPEQCQKWFQEIISTITASIRPLIASDDNAVPAIPLAFFSCPAPISRL